ncbi:TetR family transcriptional regulator [Streptomyces fumigatiscleroticus]|nr:TetR family transcriptional regulator [Streptomyces fumigatiscleroticus]
MGHREDLLEGAKRCLLQKGFARTTARDIVRESGTNLASIGYHYGSKNRLLAEAYVDLIANVGDTFDAFGADGAAGEPGSLERFEEVWANVTRSLTEARPVWMLTFEMITNPDLPPEIREYLVKAQDEGRRGVIPMFLGGAEPEPGDDSVRTLGGFYQTLLNGLTVQWLFDPGSATTAEQLTEGLRRVVGAAGKD